jgi:hypothetical protein
MKPFNASRFLQLVSNDVLQQWRKIWISTLALAGTGLICYVLNVDPHAATRPPIYEFLFTAALIGGGLALTSTIFGDMHHPLQSAQYLTLPCSNLERFFSRYLITGPVYYLYALVGYALFDWVGALIAETILDARAAAFAPFSPRMLHMTLYYFGIHALTFAGAIYFRSYALIKTALSVVLIWLGLLLVYVVALRLIYWDYFTTLLPNESIARIKFVAVPLWLQGAGACLLYLWVLYIAYQCLREHEVQREL